MPNQLHDSTLELQNCYKAARQYITMTCWRAVSLLLRRVRCTSKCGFSHFVSRHHNAWDNFDIKPLSGLTADNTDTQTTQTTLTQQTTACLTCTQHVLSNLVPACAVSMGSVKFAVWLQAHAWGQLMDNDVWLVEIPFCLSDGMSESCVATVNDGRPSPKKAGSSAADPRC